MVNPRQIAKVAVAINLSAPVRARITKKIVLTTRPAHIILTILLFIFALKEQRLVAFDECYDVFYAPC